MFVLNVTCLRFYSENKGKCGRNPSYYSIGLFTEPWCGFPMLEQGLKICSPDYAEAPFAAPPYAVSDTPIKCVELRFIPN